MKKVYEVYNKNDGIRFPRFFVKTDSEESAKSLVKGSDEESAVTVHIPWADNVKDIITDKDGIIDTIAKESNINFPSAMLNHGFNVNYSESLYDFFNLRPVDIPLIRHFGDGSLKKFDEYVEKVASTNDAYELSMALQKLEYDYLGLSEAFPGDFSNCLYCDGYYYVNGDKVQDKPDKPYNVASDRNFFKNPPHNIFGELPVEYTEDKATETMEQ